jgi:adenosine deaminase
MELAEDAAESGAVWIEPSAYVTGARAKVSGTETDSAYLEVLLEAAAAAQHATGVGIGFMLAANRTKPLQEAMDMARLAALYSGQKVVGFGLMGNEALAPPEPFVDAFAVARRAELLSVPHAGELDGPNSVRVAVDSLAAARIQHGVRAIEDPALCDRLAREAVCLDICPTSNCFLSVVEDLRDHPLPELLAAGVSVSVNADDPLFFGSTLLDEYELCRSEFGLDDTALAAIAATSIRASGAPDDLKASALAGIRRWLHGPPPAIP